MTPDPAALSAEAADVQASYQRLLARKRDVSASFARVLALRPPGIPANWLPDYSVTYTGPQSAENITVHAWFDPGHFGKHLARRS